jgi:hypothetical protein
VQSENTLHRSRFYPCTFSFFLLNDGDYSVYVLKTGGDGGLPHPYIDRPLAI